MTESQYDSFMMNSAIAHEMIQTYYDQYPELFPKEMLGGYCLNGKDRTSKKMEIPLRKIRVNGINYRIRPSFKLPYIRGKTTEVSKALFLIKFGVPFWALALVFGRNAMW